MGGLGIGCALVAILFCTAMHTTAKRYQSMFPNPYVRILVGAALVIALTCVEGSGAYNGAGSAFISAALAGEQAVPWAFLLKIAFTALTLGAGVPGAARSSPPSSSAPPFGSAVAPLLGLDPALWGGHRPHRPVLRGGQLPPGQHPAERGALRRGDGVLCPGLRPELSPQRLVLPLQQPEDRLLQAGAPVHRRQRQVTYSDNTRHKKPGAMFAPGFLCLTQSFFSK